MRFVMDEYGSIGQVLWHLQKGDGPTIGVAIHAGHEVRSELLPSLAIDEMTRLREEDPYTDYWTLACHSQIISRRSRFEVDLNRSIDSAICVQPEDCWNLDVWKDSISDRQIERSLSEYRAFYRMLEDVLKQPEQQYGKFVVFDIHSYNHCRAGPGTPAESPSQNPEINIGTGSMDRARWAGVVDRFISDIKGYDVQGRHLDVRENIRFLGRELARFVHTRFPESGCVLAIEVKKFFMNEWTGAIDLDLIRAIGAAFAATIPGIEAELNKL